MAAVRKPSAAARVPGHPKTAANRHHHVDDGNGHPGSNGWSAHVRYFLARYPPETRDFVAQRLAAYGIRSLLSSSRVEDLNLDALLSATDGADRDVLSLMRQHARGRREQRGGGRAAGAAASARRTGSPLRQAQPHDNDGPSRAAAPREALRERGVTRNTNAVLRTAPRPVAAAAGSRKRHEVAARPDVLTRFPFVDDLGETQGGGVGAAMHRATPTTPIQYLAKREIRRLAHEAFRELKASALGIRLADLPCALQFLFFGDSASLLTAKGGGGGTVDGGGGRGGGTATSRSAKDVHLVMALARESLPPTLAHAARDTSTLSSASTHGGADAGWSRDGQSLFISERRWIKVVAHVVRRLWDMDGSPSSFLAARARRQSTAAAKGLPAKPAAAATAAAAAAGPLGMGFQQPVWRPVGGGGGAGRFVRDEEENTESFLGELTADSRSDSAGGWGGSLAAPPSAISADEVDGEYYGVGGGGALRAWEEEGESWVGAGRSMAWAPGREDEVVGARGGDGSQGDGEGGGDGRLLFRPPPQGPRAARGQRRRPQDGRRGGGDGGEDWKEGTRPAGMWEVTPPAHVAALRRERRHGGGRRDGGRRGSGPAYLRGVQSRIGPQLDAHKERLRKIAGARRTAVKDVVARRRLDHLAGGGGSGGGAGGAGGVRGDGGMRDSSAADWGSEARGHSPGEHALDIAGAFLESSLMTRLAGGDWFNSEDGEPMSADFSSVWEAEEAVRVPPGGRRQDRVAGRHGRGHNGGGRGRSEGSRREEGGRGAAARRRQAYTGWLGDFGPVHTHTVREVAGADDDEEEEEEEAIGEDGGGGGGTGGSDGRDRGSGRAPAGQEEEEEEERGARRSWRVAEGGAPGEGGSGGGGDVAEGSEGITEEGGVDESTAAVASEAARVGVVDGTLSGAADSGSEVPGASGSGGVGGVGRQEPGADDSNNNDENMVSADPGNVNVIAPLDGGLDAYLQLASGSRGALLGGGGGLDGGDGGGSARGAGPGAGVSGGSPGAYTGATSGSWWEEDRSEVATSAT